jgi:wyosine [tRNA(Phe)-imidazoG37] synthetase (radical SAM superfamily)
MKSPLPILSYGPVPSRRLGQSLGINNIPAKVCSYFCLYCQVGKNTETSIQRRTFYQPEDIFRDVQARVLQAREKGAAIDYLAFVPDGEPTLDANLGASIRMLHSLEIPIAVITNASLISRPDVQNDLALCDWVSLKMDAVREEIWKKIDRPHGRLKLPDILQGMRDFSRTFKNTLVTETMLVQNVNDQEKDIQDIADFLKEISPATAYLAVPTRPPAQKNVQAAGQNALVAAYEIFSQRLDRVEYLVGYEGDAFASTGDIGRDILGITAVHPMRKNALETLLNKNNAGWDVVQNLLDQGLLVQSRYQGHEFYLRQWKKKNQ